jgi:hypothetical protein
MAKGTRPGPKRRTLERTRRVAKSDPTVAGGAIAKKPRSDEPALPQAAFEFPAKRRCHGATRYGQPCRLWATAGGEFCYWCEQAGRPRYPLTKPDGEAASSAGTARIRKQRCRGVTVFGEPCRSFSAGTGNLCLWCLGAGKLGKDN